MGIQHPTMNSSCLAGRGKVTVMQDRKQEQTWGLLRDWMLYG